MTLPLEPRAFQKQVAELLLIKKRNVILQAPTGSGKTHAALLPFLAAVERGIIFPNKCIYSVPMRVLANQFFADYKRAIKQAGRDDYVRVSIQTGDNQKDREFAANLIFATIDQTLSSFLISPYSLSRRKANINGGAVTGAYLVFDEFHLYGKEMLQTTLQMLKMLQGITPFILMTATFSTEMLNGLADILDACVVPSTPEAIAELQSIESQQKERYYHTAQTPLSAKTVLDKHTGRSLVICNRVNRAQQLYESLCKLSPQGVTVLLLHSRFLPEDRDHTEDLIRKMFAKGCSNGDYIVISTQAIEVGLDITSTALHTELAPANAIIQRAGRCARYQGDVGHVYIYSQVETPNSDAPIDLLKDVMPYKGKGNLFQATWQQFKLHDEQKLSFADEQAIVTAVHGAEDTDLLKYLGSRERQHQLDMFAVMSGNHNVGAPNLIRDAFQQQVTVHANPDVLLGAPFDASSFGLHTGTMQAYIRTWMERSNELDLPWAVQWLKQLPDPDQSNRTDYKWIPVREEPKEALGAPLIVVHPLLATYNKQLGFVSDHGGEWETSLSDEKVRKENPPRMYRLETYAEHIQQVHRAFTELWPEMAYAAGRLEQRFGWATGSVYRAAELAVLLHDVGKLSVGWQQWAHTYQTAVSQFMDDKRLLPRVGEAYAHTTVQGNDFQEIAEKIKPKRPWHAVESAIASAPTFMAALGQDHPLTFAAISAIARHHAAHSDTNQAFRLSKQAAKHIQSTLDDDRLFTLEGVDGEIPARFGISQILAQPEDEAYFLPYLLIVRVLRRADQLGTARGTQGV